MFLLEVTALRIVGASDVPYNSSTSHQRPAAYFEKYLSPAKKAAGKNTISNPHQI